MTDPAQAQGQENAVRVVTAFDGFRIYLHGVLHLAIKRAVDGIQVWRDYEGRWTVEYTLDGGSTVTTEYDTEEKVRAVLAGLNACGVTR